jgi:cation:H+ antiporter
LRRGRQTGRGTDILNVLWIIGMSAAVTPITVPVKIINFAFPWMLAIVLTMLASMRLGHRLTRPKGVLLFILYAAYIASAVKWFY